MTRPLNRRRFLKTLTAGAIAAGFPELWLPRTAHAQTSARGSVRHVLFIRLASGFRFTAAFNARVGGNFNPYGAARVTTEWAPSTLLQSSTWLTDTGGDTRVKLGMKPVTAFASDICVLPCVDHEPTSARADGNHGTGLERFLTGYVGGSTAFLSYANYAVRERVAAALAQGQTLLPAFSLGEAGMASGAGIYATYRPPVLDGAGFDSFAKDPEGALPAWAQRVAGNMDGRLQARLSAGITPPVDNYRLSREQAHVYNRIFTDELLQVDNRSSAVVDGISNQQLEQMFGTTTTGRRAALALRLFHFGCPVVFMNQGGYDFHSKEEAELPMQLDEACRLLSGFRAALQRMKHPEGGTYWDKTLVVMGSEFGRTTGEQRFNSAGGSDHSSDYATRWMSMPLMGGVISAAGKGGRQIGGTDANTLSPTGSVFSYRSVLKTLLDLLGGDHAAVFPADNPIQELFT